MAVNKMSLHTFINYSQENYDFNPVQSEQARQAVADQFNIKCS